MSELKLHVLKPNQLDMKTPLRHDRLHKLELPGHPGESILDGRIADPERLLHFLDSALATHKRHDEYLVFRSQPCERRQFEVPLDGYSLFCQPHALTTPHEAMLAGLGDGSVRMVASGVSSATWLNACIPNDGNVLGTDW